MSYYPILYSWRLVYTICAFFAIASQILLNNSVNFAILCMVKDPVANGNCSTVKSECSNIPYNNTTTQHVISEDNSGEFTWSMQQRWIFISYFCYGSVISQLLAGRLVDKYGGKLFLMMSTISQSIVFLLIPEAARISYWLAVILRFIQGFWGGFIVPSVNQLYTVWAHNNEKDALVSFAFSGYSVGALLAFPISGFLCQFGWPYTFYILGGVMLSVSLVMTQLVYNTLDSHPWVSEEEKNYLKILQVDMKTNLPVPWRKMFTSCAVIAFILTHICHSYGLITFNTILPMFLKSTINFSLNEVAYYSSAYNLGCMTSKIVVILVFNKLYQWSGLNKSTFQRTVYCSGNIFSVLALAGITSTASGNPITMVVLIFLLGASSDLSFSAGYWVSSIDIAPSFAGLLTGVANSLATLSGIVAPTALPYIVVESTKNEWNYIFFSMIFTYFIGLIIYGSFGTSERQEWSQPAEKS